MSNPLRLTLVLLALAFAITSARAQNAGAGEPQLVKRIFDVLNSTALEAKKWDDKAIAARTQARIADLLWDAYTDNAIDHLKTSWSTAAQVDEPNRERSTVVNPSLRNAVRRDVL